MGINIHLGKSGIGNFEILKFEIFVRNIYIYIYIHENIA
jgi:hypothetical protein